MSEVQYPNRDDLRWWVEDLSKGTGLPLKLPNIDEEWYDLILDSIQRVHYSPESGDLNRKAAQIFYNIAKGHNFVDGNKRSSIVVVYLFYLINDHIVRADMLIGDLARKVARSHGRSRHDEWIEKIELEFKNKLRYVGAPNQASKFPS